MSIFGDVEPPRWLQDLTRQQPGELGATLGTALGGGLLALQPDTQAAPDENGKYPMKGFQKGLAEARMNEQDPNWRVKTAALEAQTVGAWARSATEWQSLDSTKRDMATWTTYDLPAISKFQEELKTNPEAVPPVVQSGKGVTVLNQLERSQIQMQQMRLRQDVSKLNLENAKTSVAFDQAVSAAPVGIAAAIDELPNQGWNIDRQGKRTTPSTKALQLYNDWATDGGKNLDKAFGWKPNSVDTAKARGEAQMRIQQQRGQDALATAEKRTEGQLKVVDETGKIRTDLEGVRQKNRVELVGAKELSQEKLEALKAKLKPDAQGKVKTERDFVEREFRTVYSDLRKNPQVDASGKIESEQVSAQRARQILQRVYQSMVPKVAAPTAASPATNAPPAAVAAPAAAGTNDVSFDDFQKWKGGK